MVADEGSSWRQLSPSPRLPLGGGGGGRAASQAVCSARMRLKRRPDQHSQPGRVHQL